MKTKIYATVLMTAVIILMSNTGCASRRSASNNIVSTEIAVSSFERINIGSNANVRFHLADEHRVMVSIDENFVEQLDIRTTRNNTLNIGVSGRNTNRITRFVVDVYSPRVTNVSISGAGTFTAVDAINVPRLEVNVSGAGRMSGTIETTNFVGNISGSGNISLYGNARNANITVSGSGSFNGDRLLSRNVTVNVSGSGSANVYAIESLTARVSGSGSVIHRGEPSSIDTRVSGTGRITRR